MKAIILNSGIGKRMGELTKDRPKCLVELTNGETVLSKQVRAVINNGIRKIIMTTGPFEGKIKEYMAVKFPKVNVEYINNPLYSTTNYIYSLFLIPQELINDDIILMHGDLVFEEKILTSLIESKAENAVPINFTAPLPAKDFKGKVENGFITRIGVEIFGMDCFALMPLYRLSKNAFLRWLNEIKEFITNGETSVYAEDAFNRISSEMNIRAFDYGEGFCMEIDTVDDLLIARNQLGSSD